MEALILQPPVAKSQLTGKDPDAGEDWREEEKGATEDEIIEWHHWLSGHVFEQTAEDSEGQESSGCSTSWDCKELDMTEQLNNNNDKYSVYYNLSNHSCVSDILGIGVFSHLLTALLKNLVTASLHISMIIYLFN